MTRLGLESFLKMTRLGLESRNLPFNVCAGKKFLEVDFGAPLEKNWRLKFVKLGANIADNFFFSHLFYFAW